MIERGTCKYRYMIHIDLEPIVDEIMNVLSGYHDGYNFEGDGEDLCITGWGETPYKKYYSPATILDPPEEDLIVDTIEDVDLKKAILEALHRLDHVRIDAEMLDEEYEPDREDD